LREGQEEIMDGKEKSSAYQLKTEKREHHGSLREQKPATHGKNIVLPGRGRAGSYEKAQYVLQR